MVLKHQANIIITGTPGTGKSSHAQALVDKIPGLKLLDVNAIAKEHKCYAGHDDERKADIIDDEKLLDVIEDDLERGNQVIDWHCCDVFPENLVDLVVVLRTSTSVLFDRLKERNYEQKKIDENMDAEIMEVLLNDAREVFDEEIIVELQSDKIEDVQENIDRIAAWYENWCEEHPDGVKLFELSDESDSDESD